MLFFALAIWLPGVASSSEIPIYKQIGWGPWPSQWPRHQKPRLLYLERGGHYAFKNKISINAGYKNVRDGMYVRSPWQTTGRLMNGFDTTGGNLKVVSYREVGCGDLFNKYEGYSCLCPPKKLPNLRHKILLYAYGGGMCVGVCSMEAFYINLHRSRASGLMWPSLFTRDYRVGYWETVSFSNGAQFWRTRQLHWMSIEVNPASFVAIDSLLERDRSFDLMANTGHLRPGVEFSDNLRYPTYGTFAFLTCITIFPLALQCVIGGLRQLPYHFKQYLHMLFKPAKKIKAQPAKIQMVVCPMESYADLMIVIHVFLGTVKPNLFTKGSLLGSNFFFGVVWAFDYRVDATVSTLFMAVNWMNEAAAARKMCTAQPILVARKRPLAAASLLLLYGWSVYLRVIGLLIGCSRLEPTVTIFVAVVINMMSIACAAFFQRQAGKVTKQLSAASEANAAMNAFRRKMIENLAKSGSLDVGGAILYFIVFSSKWTWRPTHFAIGQTEPTLSRILVSSYQLAAIEPSALTKARKDARNKVRAKVKSMTSSSSMSSSVSLESTGSSSTSSSTTSSSAASTATTTP